MKNKKILKDLQQKLSTQVRSLIHLLELLLDPSTPAQPMCKRVQENIKVLIILVHRTPQEKH